MCKRINLAFLDEVASIDHCDKCQTINVYLGWATLHLHQDSFVLFALMIDEASCYLADLLTDEDVSSVTQHKANLASKKNIGTIRLIHDRVDISLANMSFQMESDKFIVFASLVAEAHSEYMDMEINAMMESIN